MKSKYEVERRENVKIKINSKILKKMLSGDREQRHPRKVNTEDEVVRGDSWQSKGGPEPNH